MPETSQQSGPIAVYGATGYTGRLIAAELHRRGADLVLAGRNRVRRGLDALVGWLPEGPSKEARRDARFTVVCDARTGERRRRGIVSGFDVYGLTARTTVEAALLCSAPGFDRAGALAPSQAFGPREFVRALAAFDVTYEVVPLSPEP